MTPCIKIYRQNLEIFLSEKYFSTLFPDMQHFRGPFCTKFYQKMSNPVNIVQKMGENGGIAVRGVPKKNVSRWIMQSGRLFAPIALKKEEKSDILSA